MINRSLVDMDLATRMDFYFSKLEAYIERNSLGDTEN